MELVRAYVTLGFKTVKTIKSEDVDRIVDRYLKGHDMQTIAREEARRIRKESRSESISVHHTSGPPTAPRHPYTGEPYDDDSPTEEEEIEQSLRRPPVRDSNLPEGFEMRNGLYVPISKPLTIEEKEKQVESLRVKARNMDKLWFLTAILLFAANIIYAWLDMSVPIGVLMLIPFLWTLWCRNHTQNKHHKARRELEELRVNQLLNNTNEFRGRGTVSVRR